MVRSCTAGYKAASLLKKQGPETFRLRRGCPSSRRRSMISIRLGCVALMWKTEENGKATSAQSCMGLLGDVDRYRSPGPQTRAGGVVIYNRVVLIRRFVDCHLVSDSTGPTLTAGRASGTTSRPMIGPWRGI